MKTKIFTTEDNYLKTVCELLTKGEVVALPTETVYGLCANALDEKAVVKIFEAKNRPCDNPLIIHIANKDDIFNLVSELPDNAKKCIDAGFSSVMFDGSHYPIEENIAKTTELVKVCADKGLSLEAEVGAIGGEEDGVIGGGEVADPKECKMIADLGVTMLAAGIGNIHGKYPANWGGLRFDALEAISAQVGDMPLVLHGGTGIPADMIQKAISLGVSKINVNTECQLAFAAATREYVEAGKDLQGKGFDPRKLLAPGFEAIKATVKEKMELFGSVNKA